MLRRLILSAVMVEELQRLAMPTFVLGGGQDALRDLEKSRHDCGCLCRI